MPQSAFQSNFRFNSREMSALNTRRQKLLIQYVRAAERESAKAAKACLVGFSSGGYSARYLNQLGRQRGAGVYSRRAADSSFDNFIINAQSGRFRAAWKITPPVLLGDTMQTKVYNDSPEAKFMQGTNKMIPRRINAAMFALQRGPRFARLQAAYRRALKG